MRISSAIAGFLVVGIAAAQDATVSDPVSGMKYPASVGTFTRIASGKSDSGALTATYRKNNSTFTITVSAFETSTVFAMLGMPKSRADMDKAYCLTGIDRESRANASDVAVKDEGDASLRRSGSSRSGYRKSYALTLASFLDSKNVAVHTDLYRFCMIDNRWTVQYRVDYLPGVEPAADVKMFMRDLEWTIGKP